MSSGSGRRRTSSLEHLGGVFHRRWLPLQYTVVNQTKMSHKSRLPNLACWQCLRVCYLDLFRRSSGMLQAGLKASSEISGKREASRPSFLFRWALCWKHSSNLGLPKVSTFRTHETANYKKEYPKHIDTYQTIRYQIPFYVEKPHHQQDCEYLGRQRLWAASSEISLYIGLYR